MTAGERAVSVGRGESLLKKERRRVRSACREREEKSGQGSTGRVREGTQACVPGRHKARRLGVQL